MQSGVKRGANSIKQMGDKAARGATTSPIMEATMRLGYVVRGLVYGMIGLLALQVAAGVGGSLDDPQGAIAALGKTPLGSVVLYAILIGLVGYALWGFVRAITDPLHKGSDAKGIAVRVGYVVSGISYLLLALATYGLITGATSGARNGAQTTQTQQTAATILAKPWGPAAVAIAGIVVIVIGAIQVFQGINSTFDKQFDPYALTPHQRTWIDRLGRFGTAARGVVFAMIGLFLFTAGLNHNASQAQGIDGVLNALLHQPAGPWLLGVVALGLIAFGIYSGMSGILLRFKR
ncbi:MAG: DUF1206 domain-containing protein [Chloroflexota bacterium]